MPCSGAGLDAPTASPTDVAKFTVQTMLNSVPPSVPGIHFLSGGMSEEESTLNLQALQVGPDPPLWSDTCASFIRFSAPAGLRCHAVTPQAQCCCLQGVCHRQHAPR